MLRCQTLLLCQTDGIIIIPHGPLEDSCTQSSAAREHSEDEVAGYESTPRLGLYSVGDLYPFFPWSINGHRIFELPLMPCKPIIRMFSHCACPCIHPNQTLTSSQANPPRELRFNRPLGMQWTHCPLTSWLLIPLKIQWCYHLPLKSVPWDAERSTRKDLDMELLPGQLGPF